MYTFNSCLHASKRIIFTFPQLPFNRLLIKSDRRAFTRFLPYNHHEHTLNLTTEIIKHIINIRGLYNTQCYEKNTHFFLNKEKTIYYQMDKSNEPSRHLISRLVIDIYQRNSNLFIYARN